MHKVVSRGVVPVLVALGLTAAGIGPAWADDAPQTTVAARVAAPPQPDPTGTPAVATAPVPPVAGVSHYIRSLRASQTTTQIKAATKSLGAADARAAGSSSPQVVLLQFGAQTNRAGGDGSGNGSSLGIRQSATDMRLTYAQVSAAVGGYLSGYASAADPQATNPVTVAIGTSTAGYEGATYTPTAKGRDWANKVVEPAVTFAGRYAPRITVVAGNDIEANFDASISQVKSWVSAYLAAGPNALVNNGAAVQCPSTPGRSGATCGPVAVEESTTVHTWKQSDYVAVSAGLGPGRISVLPQVYASENAVQWANIALTAAAAGTPLTFAGVLTSVAACAPAGSGCASLTPSAAWTKLNQALDAYPATASLTVPAATDLTIS